jgi:hypothetical protein
MLFRYVRDPGKPSPGPASVSGLFHLIVSSRASPPLERPVPPIQQCRLSEIPCHVLRVECIRCFRIVEIQKADAVRYYGPHAVWKDVGQRLLDQTCTNRTGRHEEDGCRPDWT